MLNRIKDLMEIISFNRYMVECESCPYNEHEIIYSF